MTLTDDIRKLILETRGRIFNDHQVAATDDDIARAVASALVVDEVEAKDCLLKADLEYHKQPCVDDGFSEWLSSLATALSTAGVIRVKTKKMGE